MAGNSSSGGNATFGSVLHTEAETLQQKAAQEGAQAREAQSRDRMAGLLSSNSTLPVTLSSVQIHGAKNTRKSFLDPIFEPLVEESRNANYNLSDMLEGVGVAAEKLQKFDIFHDDFSMNISQPSRGDPSSTPTDIDVALRVREKSRLLLKTGTDVGNTEGSVYGSLLLRNMFGGAESLSLNATSGTRTRSAYTAEFSTPVNSNPNLRLSLDGLASSTQKPWASHEEALRGGGIRFNWLNNGGDRLQFGYSNTWRQLTGLAAIASPSVRADAGDSVKSALAYTFTRDRRDNPMMPQNGYLFKTATELAGWGPLGGDVAFSKNEVEMGGAVPVSIPGIGQLSGVSIGAGFKAGMLYPLPLSYGMGGAKPSRINDRFTLGGPTDVRGFTTGGLGPRQSGDSLGGDVFAAGSVNMLLPVPRAGAESPLRLQIFANGGRSVAMNYKTENAKSGMSASTVWSSLVSALQEAGTGLPSLAAGVGLVYAHPVARFELNFSLPLVQRRGEEARKGLQIGVGINFL